MQHGEGRLVKRGCIHDASGGELINDHLNKTHLRSAEAVVAEGHASDKLRLKLHDNLVTISLAEAERLVVEVV